MAVLYIRDKTTSEFIPINTIQGFSAYQVAVKDGFIGTEAEWLASLKGDPGSLENLTKTNVESVLTGEITSHIHDTLYQKLVSGKGLSTNDFTTALLTKLNGLSNYDDTAAIARIVVLETWKTALTGTSADDIINTFNEIEAFLQGITGVDSLTKILSDMRADILAQIPTNNNTLTNGAGYQTATNVTALITTALADYLRSADIYAWAKASTKPSYSQSEISNDDHTVKDASYVHTDNNFTAAYKSILDRSGINAVTTLANLPIDKDVIYATLSAATNISLASALSLGQSITIVCLPSAGFTQPIPTSNGFTSMDGDSLTFVSGKLAEISILCYATNNYSISSKIAS